MQARTASARKTALLVLPRLSAGGAEAVLCSVARELAQWEDWDVVVASMGGADLVAPDVGAANLLVLQGSGKPGTEWRLLWLLWRRRYDLALSSHIRVNAALSLFRRMGLLSTRRLVTRESTVFSDRAGALKMIAYRFLYSLYGSQDLLVAQTDYMASRMKEVLPRRLHGAIRVLGNPVDVDHIRRLAARRPAAPLEAWRGRPLIAWCGRLVAIKQPLLAVEALHCLRNRFGIDAAMIMVGWGPLAPEVTARADELGLGGDVLLTGQLENPYAVMRACQVGLLTSRREGFPNVVLEMLASGVGCVVTTDCAEGLGALPRTSISGPAPDQIASTLADALRRQVDQVQDVEEMLQRRTPRSFTSELARESLHGGGSA